MTETVLYAGRPEQREAYARHLADAFAEAGLAPRLVMEPGAVPPGEVDWIVFAANGPVTDLRPYTRLKAILNLWAGVETVLALDLPPGVPLCRMVEPGLTLGMTDYVMAHVLRHHHDIDRYIGTAPREGWETGYPPLPGERTVGILGLGALGAAAGAALAHHGFRVMGWARGPKDLPGIEAHAGSAGLDVVLARAEILVLLLPHTAETARILDARALATLPRGASVVNAGRGALIDEAALLAALDRGHIAHATLDVFDVEPLPADHPYWRHPRVTVTPHIASVTRPRTASRAIAANIARGLGGERLVGVVDRGLGY